MAADSALDTLKALKLSLRFTPAGQYLVEGTVGAQVVSGAGSTIEDALAEVQKQMDGGDKLPLTPAAVDTPIPAGIASVIHDLIGNTAEVAEPVREVVTVIDAPAVPPDVGQAHVVSAHQDTIGNAVAAAGLAPDTAPAVPVQADAPVPEAATAAGAVAPEPVAPAVADQPADAPAA